MFRYVINSVKYFGLDKNETLFKAAENGDLLTVQEQIALGADVTIEYRCHWDLFGNMVNGEYSNALAAASNNGSVEIVDLLLGHGANINSRNRYSGRTPLQLAALNNHLKMVQRLVEKNAEVDFEDKKGLTSLFFAAYNKNGAMVNFLLERGANPKKIEYIKHSEQIIAFINKVSNKQQLSALEKTGSFNNYLQNTKNINVRLGNAARNGYIETVKQCLSSLGANIEFEDMNQNGVDIKRDHLRPLHLAVADGYEEIVKLLIEHGADVNAFSDYYSRTPLHMSAQFNQFNIAKILVTAGADVNPKSQDAETYPPLYYAAREENEEFVKFLLENEADLKLVENLGFESVTLFVKKIMKKYALNLNHVNNDVSLKQVANKSKYKNMTLASQAIIEPENLNDELVSFIEKTQPSAFIRTIDPYYGWKYIRAIQKTLSSNKNISHLILDNCFIGDKGLSILGSIMEINDSISYLSLSKNNISSYGISEFAKCLEKNKGLVYLNLHYNDIWNHGAIHLGRSIQLHPNLLYVDLTSNPIEEAGCIAILMAIKLQGLKHSNVDLSDPSTNNIFYKDICLGIFDPNVLVSRTINRIQNYSNQDTVKELTIKLPKVIKTTSHLWQNLSLKGSLIDDKALDVLNEIFNCTKLRSLELLYPIGIFHKNFTNSLSLNSALEYLNLSNNYIGDPGIEILSKFLANHATLNVLNLASNRITDLGLMKLTNILPYTNLCSLNISSNYICTREYIKELAMAWRGLQLQRATAADSLDISCNYLSEGENNSFTGLLMQYNFFKSSGANITETSKIDKELTFSNDKWLVFLAYNPKDNHAVILIEGIDVNGQNILQKLELTAPKSFITNRGKVNIDIWPKSNKSNPFKSLEYYNYDSWICSKEKVKCMVLSAENESLSESILFDRLGKNGDNCLTWAIKKLKLMGINANIPIIPMPNLYIGYQKITENMEDLSDEKNNETGKNLLHTAFQAAVSDFEKKTIPQKVLNLSSEHGQQNWPGELSLFFSTSNFNKTGAGISAPTSHTIRASSKTASSIARSSADLRLFKDLTSRGLILSKKENFTEALVCFKRAITLDKTGVKEEDIATLNYNLGATYFKLKDYDKALPYLQQALDVRMSLFDANDEKVLKIKSKIKECLLFQRKDKNDDLLSSNNISSKSLNQEISASSDAQFGLPTMLLLTKDGQNIVPASKIDTKSMEASLQGIFVNANNFFPSSNRKKKDNKNAQQTGSPSVVSSGYTTFPSISYLSEGLANAAQNIKNTGNRIATPLLYGLNSNRIKNGLSQLANVGRAGIINSLQQAATGCSIDGTIGIGGFRPR